MILLVAMLSVGQAASLPQTEPVEFLIQVEAPVHPAVYAPLAQGLAAPRLALAATDGPVRPLRRPLSSYRKRAKGLLHTGHAMLFTSAVAGLTSAVFFGMGGYAAIPGSWAGTGAILLASVGTSFTIGGTVALRSVEYAEDLERRLDVRDPD